MNKLNLKLSQINYQAILIDKYKELGLKENEVVILLLIDQLLKEQPTLVTKELLALKMTLSEKEIDQYLVDLMNRGFLEYQNYANYMTTSIEPTLKRLMAVICKDQSDPTAYTNGDEDKIGNIFEVFQKEFGRVLTGIELERIRFWIENGYSEEVILDCLHEASMKNKRITIRLIDKLLLQRTTHQERNEEGFSTVNSNHANNLDNELEEFKKNW